VRRRFSSGIAECHPPLSFLFVFAGNIFMKCNQYNRLRLKSGQRVLLEFINLQWK
jgi:hypothetical protein